jgi:hypothetical protein
MRRAAHAADKAGTDGTSMRSWLTYPKQRVKDDFEQVRMKNV